MPTITLYGTPISTYVRTIRLLLAAAEVSYDLKSVDIFNGENQSAEYLTKHPFGKVPAIAVDDVVIYETAAIATYLDATVAAGRFTPADPLGRARLQQVIGVIDHYLYDPVVHDIVIQRLVVPTQGGQADEARIAAAMGPVQTAIVAIEALTVGTPYLLGSAIGIADFFLIPIFYYLAMTPEFTTAVAAAPKLQAWWQVAQALPMVKTVCR